MNKATCLTSLKWIYKVLRSIIFSAVILVVLVLALLYIALSIPPVQNMIREKTEKELSAFLGSKVEIDQLTIRPLSEVIANETVIYDLSGKKCLEIGRLGAGVNFWKLLLRQEIEITYVELLDFKADIYQTTENTPLNIDFIIQAFAPKDKNSPPKEFDLKIHNIVLRNGDVFFSKLWKPQAIDGVFDPSHIHVENLSGDITIPVLKNDLTSIDLRRLSFSEKSGLQVKELSGKFKIVPDNISVSDFILRLPQSQINIRDFSVPVSLFSQAGKDIVELRIYDSRITPSNFSAFYRPLALIDRTFNLEVAARGNSDSFSLTNFSLSSPEGLSMHIVGEAEHFLDPDKRTIKISEFNLISDYLNTQSFLELVPQSSHKPIADILAKALGNIQIAFKGEYNENDGLFDIDSGISTAIGNLKVLSKGQLQKNAINGNFHVDISSFSSGELFPSLPVKALESAIIDVEGTLNYKDLMASNGIADIAIEEISIAGREISNIKSSFTKEKNHFSGDLTVAGDGINGELKANAFLNGSDSEWDFTALIDEFDTYSAFLDEKRESGYKIKGNIEAFARGNSIENIEGLLKLRDLTVARTNGKVLNLDFLNLEILNEEGSGRTISLNSNIADVSVNGNFNPANFQGFFKETLWQICPAIFPKYETENEFGAGNFKISVKHAEPLIAFFDIPVFPLTEITFDGNFDSRINHLELSTNIPYIQQGKNKLITDTYFSLDVNGTEGNTYLGAGTVYPTKKGLLKLDFDLTGKNGIYDLILDFNRGRNVAFDGNISLQVLLEKNPFAGIPDITALIRPTSLSLNQDVWNVEDAVVKFNGDNLEVEGFCIRHDDQFVSINGNSSKNGDGIIHVNLADIDLDELFETLNIPNVTFGGKATGSVMASKLFSSDPVVNTENLIARDLSYNGAILGDADLKASLDLPGKKISIGALINENGEKRAVADGGVWFGRDSLAFAFDAYDVNIGFMQPFMAAFSSSVKGRASGQALLYGTFSDIDMKGKIIANDAQILIDFINVSYTGSDTVYLNPGKIDIPNLLVRDRFGHTAIVEGELTHRYFHEPSFNFKIKDMDKLMVYNTNSSMNKLWYGTIFASGVGEITGKPGLVRIAADVVTERGSDFTFVLSDQQEAVKSNFLTFTDKRKAFLQAAMPKDTVPDFLKRFHQTENHVDESHDIYTMDFRVSVTDDVKFNLIMDPVGGDKITAYGTGAMNMTYSSLTDELKLYGKYTLDKGSYNFTLQDIILKDFTIKPGSSIAFTGNPYTGILDITAAYKVNTSLTELDRSFANDRELNRTSVPVEALLKVTGVLTSPQIGFDIELPTVTEETAQKVRSIISTEDMMSRQVLYLVALNKFYPPEYMTTSNSGGEWASIASSTISSQLQNMIGQITDKFTLAPSIRSDKGDFSDIEVDIALSSQLFHNRLLLNGNVGYRDPSNSNTTFIGDFDLEYLLNRKGTWRLKAYNHFNDQNYYLKSALTTQGLGIVWRKDFGLPRKKEEKDTVKDKKILEFK